MTIKTTPVILLSLALGACQDATQNTPVELSLAVLSSAPHLVTGGDAMIEVRYRTSGPDGPELT